MKDMWKALPAAVIGLLLGGSAYLLAAPGDGTSTPAAPAVSSGAVPMIELKAPPPPRHRRNHRRAQRSSGRVVQAPGSTHQLVDTRPEQPATGGGGAPSGHSHRPPEKRSQPKPLKRTVPPSVGSGEDEENEDGDSDSQGGDSNDHGSENSQGEDSGGDH